MSFLTLNQKTTLLNLLASSGLTGVEANGAANSLNAPTLNLAATPAQILSPVDFDSIVAAISSASAVNLSNSNLLQPFRAAITSQLRSEILSDIKFFAKGNMITSAEVTAINLIVNTMVTDPNWVRPIDGPSLFAQALPGFFAVIDGVGYSERCHSALVLEARI